MGYRVRSRAGAGQLLLTVAFAACGSHTVDSDSPSAVEDCCSEFDYVLEVTIFQIDVVHLYLRVDPETGLAVSSMVSRGSRSRALEDSVVEALLRTPSAYARMTFLMEMSAERFLDNTIETLEGMGEEGLLTAAEVDNLVRSARRRFAFLNESGITAGDYLEQLLHGDSLKTRFFREDGERSMEDVQIGRAHRIALLGSYFSEASDFRDGLLDQVFGSR
jgi:hypothetical protein